MKKLPGAILIVDDDEHVIFTSQLILKEYFEIVESLSSPKTLDSKLRQRTYDVILLDMNFKAGATSGNEGIFWLGQIQHISPASQVVVQTAYADIELAVKSIKNGAVDFLPKPWDKEKLVVAMVNSYEQSRARKENKNLKSKQLAVQEQGNSDGRPFIASAPSMLPVLHTIQLVSATDAAVLILGENGTGKELVARDIHEQSNRRGGPFIAVDMGTLPPSLFESEMFGHEKGSFTDAVAQRIGKFELANKGTLFLDEVGNLPLDLQVKLLSALQSKSIVRVGGTEVVQLDIRVICATNAPIYELVREGSFRQDLFYRIKTVEIPLPPLRDRLEDIPALFDYYFDLFKLRYGKSVDVSKDLVAELKRYHWPGNIRELEHAVERAVILCRTSELTIADFQLMKIIDRMSAFNMSNSLNLADVEKEVIRRAIVKHQNNLTRAAEELGIGRTTLYRKLEEYDIQIAQ